ncbi:FxLD family lanthipeptide [Actinomadura geliboluensis]|uniref:FxLD family lanthipeptide n=1 Tax=Actinomadura geliboluensis TaxID=882440 RepID=UPI002631DC96|nr:FxLD family lanthipeptide [Actinomadura geliboluensis]
MRNAITEQQGGIADESADEGTDFDPFNLDITFIEGTPAAETALMCSTGDNCGSSCPSACTTS